MGISQSQLTKLGERLKRELVADDLRRLDEYRRSFAPACDWVVHLIRDRLELQPTMRSAKSTQAIVEKLRRQSIRLGQIQDVAGCRIMVASIAEQDAAVARLRALLPDCELDDRRLKPSHGYRAVHLIVKWEARWVEVQVRTGLQHLWASLSEKLADAYGNEVKYGQGHADPLALLESLSDLVMRVEAQETSFGDLLRIHRAPDELGTLSGDLARIRQELVKFIQGILDQQGAGG